MAHTKIHFPKHTFHRFAGVDNQMAFRRGEGVYKQVSSYGWERGGGICMTLINQISVDKVSLLSLSFQYTFILQSFHIQSSNVQFTNNIKTLKKYIFKSYLMPYFYDGMPASLISILLTSL